MLSDEYKAAALADCTGVVLAGGRSTRMGEDKAALEIGGESLLRRVVRRLQVALPEVLVVGPEHLAALVPDVRVAPDRAAHLGPLGGLATALAVAETPRVFLVACDMPFVEPELVRAMARLAAEPPPVDALLLRSPAGLEYLHAVYAASCLLRIETVLAGTDRSLRRLVSLLTVREMPREQVARYDPQGLSAFNANTPSEWDRALAIARDDHG